MAYSHLETSGALPSGGTIPTWDIDSKLWREFGGGSISCVLTVGAQRSTLLLTDIQPWCCRTWTLNLNLKREFGGGNNSCVITVDAQRSTLLLPDIQPWCCHIWTLYLNSMKRHWRRAYQLCVCHRRTVFDPPHDRYTTMVLLHQPNTLSSWLWTRSKDLHI